MRKIDKVLPAKPSCLKYWPGKVEAPGAPGWRGTYPSETLIKEVLPARVGLRYFIRPLKYGLLSLRETLIMDPFASQTLSAMGRLTIFEKAPFSGCLFAFVIVRPVAALRRP